MKNAVFFIVFVCLLIIAISGCKKAEQKTEGLTDTLRIPPSCGSDNQSVDSCCYDECVNYCGEHNLPYTKHYPNRIHCGCWCG